MTSKQKGMLVDKELNQHYLSESGFVVIGVRAEARRLFME
jgi:hypothetical protein